MDLELAGKVVLITGGTDGLGLTLAAQLAGEGASVAVCGRSELVAPDLDFRVASDGEEYCVEHLPKPASSPSAPPAEKPKEG